MDDLMKLVSDMGGEITADGAADPAAALSGLQSAVQQEGGIDGLMSKLRAGGLGEQVDSWVSTGSIAPVQPAQLEHALGPDTVQHLSANSGLNIGQLLPLLAAFLPQIINMLTPNGSVPGGGLNQGGMPDLGGLLGGLTGGGAGASGSGGLDDVLGGLGGLLGGSKQ
jgi:uncharacterized protein YidB (DUF937 family)